MEHQAGAKQSLAGVCALTFDVQGTCADFCQPLLRMGESINAARGLAIDWAALSAAWRGLYRSALDQIIAGQRPWLRVACANLRLIWQLGAGKYDWRRCLNLFRR